MRLEKIDNDPLFSGIRYTSVSSIGDVPYVFSGSPFKNVTLLDFKFENLTSTQFRFLKSAYGMARSQVKFRPEKTYFLSDFLPPFAKAVLNKNFLQEGSLVGGRLHLLMTNCWSTTYEFARRADSTFQTYFAINPDNELNEFLLNGKGTYVASGLKGDPNLIRAETGDILLLYSGTTLVHMATYIDQGVWFEKTVADSNVAFRLTNNVKEIESDDPNLSFSILHLKTPEALSVPSKIFRTGTYSCSDKTFDRSAFKEYQEYEILFDADGIPFLQAKAYTLSQQFALTPWLIYYLNEKNPYDSICSDPHARL